MDEAKEDESGGLEHIHVINSRYEEEMSIILDLDATITPIMELPPSCRRCHQSLCGVCGGCAVKCLSPAQRQSLAPAHEVIVQQKSNASHPSLQRLASHGKLLLLSSSSLSQHVNDEVVAKDESKVNNNNNNNDAAILDAIRHTVKERHDQVFATWYDQDGKASDQYTFGEIWEEGGLIAYHLRSNQKWNLQKGDRVVLCYNFGLPFFAAFLGCLRAGVTAVLIYPPGLPLHKSLTKMSKVVADCAPKLVLTDSDIMLLRSADLLNPLSKTRHLWPKQVEFKDTNNFGRTATILSNFNFWKRSSSKKQTTDERTVSGQDIAFLQYTSGSTGDPKGVMVSYRALHANVMLMHESFYKTSRSKSGDLPDTIVGCSWLPQYHDMGLICAIIAPFVGGWQTHLTAPFDFIKNPLLWLDLLSRHQVHWTVAPDFAYRLVTRKFVQARQQAGNRDPIPDLDLSFVRWMINAAEPIRAVTVNRFGELFSEYGLRKDWLMAGYGLAENVVACSYLNELHLSQTASSSDRSLDRIVAVGHRATLAPSVVDVRIVNPDTCEQVDDGETGELWISGTSVAAGYYGKPEISEEVFRAKMVGSTKTFLRTGDLAFFRDDYLCICGRIKDLIIVNGVNYYPQDIEDAVQDASPAVRPGCIAAFSSDENGKDGELEIVFEIRRSSASAADSACKAVRSEVRQKIGLAPSRLVAIAEKSIPKTTSGKIQRRATRKALHEGNLKIACDVASSPTGLSNDRPVGNPVISEKEAFENIMTTFFGRDYDPEKRWDEMGMSSITSVELRDALADHFAVSLAPDCFEVYSVPLALKTHILASRGATFPVELPKLKNVGSPELSWNAMGIIQMLGGVWILLLFAASVIPAYYITSVAATANTKSIFYVGGSFVRWLWFPLAVPGFMVSFTAGVIVMKWLVIGRYEECEMSSPSVSFLRWWLIDRAVELWEFWIGHFLLDTPLLWLFYRLLGAKIHPSAKLDAFIREFDLVSIEEGASIEHQIRCRKFVSWAKDEAGPRLQFRSISVGKDCRVRGMLSPGVSLEEKSSVGIRSVVPDGAQVPAGILAKGNPAFMSDEAIPVNHNFPWWKLGAFKLIWLVIELYVFNSLLLVGQIILNDRLPDDWRYFSLLYWVLILAIYQLSSLFGGVALKWIMIGKKRPGPFQDSLWRAATDWMVDYHHRISGFVVLILTNYSRLWIILYKLYGMDVDKLSIFPPRIMAPSKVDLISSRHSYFAITTFDVTCKGNYEMTRVDQSSISYNVHLDPGVTVSRSIVPILSHVTEDIVKDTPDPKFSSKSPAAQWRTLLAHEAFTIAVVLLAFVSLIPAFELWQNVFDPQSAETAVPVLALVLVVQSLVWLLIAAAFHLVLYGNTKRTSPWSAALFMVYVSTLFSIQNFSMFRVAFGSPLFSAMARFMGAKIPGRALYFGDIFYDLPYVTLNDRTVIDGARVLCSHFQVYWDTRLGHNSFSGIIHPGTFVSPNAVVTANESGPWRAVFAGGGGWESTTNPTKLAEEVFEEVYV